MATTALLAQNDNLAIDQLKQNVGRSVFDLSHSTTFPIDVDGAILPICCLETVPSDSFEISVECLLRQLSPLKVPVMTNLRLNTAFYWCDNRLAWKKWDRFIEGGRSGNEVYDIPRMANASYNSAGNPTKNALIDSCIYESGSITAHPYDFKNTLHTYFGISFNHNFDESITYENCPDDSDELPVAFPFFDYQLICRDFYTDIDRLPDTHTGGSMYDFNDLTSDWAYENLFPPDDDSIKLLDGIQIKSGFAANDTPGHFNADYGFVLDKVRYHNVRDDYFTTSKRAPMRGDAPTISLGSATSQLDFDNLIRTTSMSSGTANTEVQPHVGTNADSLRVIKDDDGNVQIGFGPSSKVGDYYNYTVNTTANNLLKDALESGISVSTNISGQITASELRLLSQLTVWQELNMLHEPYYNDFLNAHFAGVKVGETAIEKPQYIGGTSQIIHINEIQQTSATTETSSLGTVGATAHSLENNYVGKFYCNSYGWLIGVVYIQPDILYNPALPRGFSRKTKEDFYFP